MAPASTTPFAAEPQFPNPRAFEVAFAPDKAAVGRMRRLTAAFLRLCNVRGTPADNAVPSVSELVTNGIQHGCGDIGLRVRYCPGELRIEVTDGSSSSAVLRTAEDVDESGRGLFLVAVLAPDWGVSDDGRTTWCAFRLPTGTS
ncbi:ATP-binding protein [Streptomyces sp. NPDC056405]|uniref:ATP-binding protein n=1 Tax=Streptomyces sp. NPDC056405 TaxID=3345811 RepID=UPI0035D965B5